ncbi:hypothetical protein [Aestuariicoccus sp. MJ-SS9]|uniref:hypothetical protein n=1 Tax=Aestuariicoccus sp. MJ-SS9 TaxID=3079855 RepID=UPI002910B991|nr:hypothetical protein [Aestuariicoccus sp. MJ-SS9]MDU8912779.1 hypothetical protein [Aestuariicoccus sp. MJ-SS9]
MTNSLTRVDTDELSFVSDRFDENEYAQVAQLARLQQVHLMSCEYEAKIPEILVQQDLEHGTLRPSYEGEPEAYSFDREHGFSVGEYTWRADVKQGRRKLLKLKCTYVLVYDNFQDCDEAYTYLYFKKVGRFTTYPYFRTQFSVQVGASGLTFPPLPSLIDRVD